MEAQVQSPKQSRIGRQPVPVPKGVQAQVQGTTVTVKGPKGTLSREFPREVKVVHQDGLFVISIHKDAGRLGGQYQGMTRALLRNMVQGVSEGFKISMDLYGVGYRAEVAGTTLQMTLGLSHGVRVPIPAGVKVTVETIDQAGTKRPRLHLESHDKELVGELAAHCRSFRPPEPYKGKGVRYLGEKIREKAGKAATKAGK